MFNKEKTQHTKANLVFPINNAGKTICLQMNKQTNKLHTNFISFIKINSKWIIGLYVKYKTTRLL